MYNLLDKCFIRSSVCVCVFQAALNMATKSMSVDLKPHGILAAVIDPGWVMTDMGGPDAKIDVTTSVAALLNVMEGLNENSAGTFLNYKGEIAPW